MNRLIRLGDIGFVIGWLSAFCLVIILDLALSFYISQRIRPEWLLRATAEIFWSTVVIWLVLTIWMLTDCIKTDRITPGERRTWVATMLLNLVIVGPTAYYVAS